MKTKIKSFKDLEAWKEAHKLVLRVYTLTKKFPKEERFTLTDQMRRAAISISSNIAEGFSRTSKKDKIHFYHISLGSLLELENQFQIAFDLKYLPADRSNKIQNKISLIQRLIYGLMKSSKSRDIILH